MVDDRHTHVYVWKEDFEKLKAIQNSTGQETLLQTFHNLVSPEKKALTLVNFRDSDFEKLKKIQDEGGFRDLGSVIHHIIEMQASIEMVTSEKIMKDSTPMVLSGKPLSGKTYWTKNVFIPSLKNNPILVIDPNVEYDLKEIKSFRELDLASNQHVRFCPAQHSVMGTMQVKQLFTELNMTIDINRDALKNLVLIVEEASASFKLNWFNGFLYKSRHYLRKMIAITPQTDCFQGLETFTVFH